MRVTTWLLLEHVQIHDLALLIESFIAPDISDDGEWLPSLTCDHMEHLQDCLARRRNRWILMSDACEIGDIAMINKLIGLGENEWNYGFLAAKRYNQVEAARIMIKHGADVNCGNSHISDTVGGGIQKSRDPDEFVAMYGLLLENGFSKFDEMVLPIALNDDVKVFDLIIHRLRPEIFPQILTAIGQHGALNMAIRCINIFTQYMGHVVVHIANVIMGSATSDRSAGVIKYLLTIGANPQLGINHACENGQKIVLQLRFAAGAICTCGKSSNDHTDEYLDANYYGSEGQYFNRLTHKLKAKRPREDDDH